MNQRTLMVLLVIAAIFRHTIPFIDLYFLLFLFVMLRRSDHTESYLRYFLIGSIAASFMSGIAIGLFPLVTSLVFLLVGVFGMHKAHKGLPTLLLWIGVYALISFTESILLAYLSSGTVYVPSTVIPTILVTSIVAFIGHELALLQKRI